MTPSTSLKPGGRIAHFEVVSLVGRGGMGDVFHARDTRLGRDVAIKVLSEKFAGDLEALNRFSREARILAALVHPQVAAIHGLEEHDGLRFLVLEFVPGETLGERIARGAVPQGEALEIARQIALGLEAAHEKGIIHRDLKPANVKLTEDGRVKVLDFGIAKMIAGLDKPGNGQSQAQNPATVTLNDTDSGIVLGTAAYMSPEQARGKVLDRRTDVWSFGCVLYEALTGRRAFSGSTATDTLSAVLGSDPDWEALPDETPAGIFTLLRRCLEKDRDRRLHDVADARIEIEEVLAAAPGSRAVMPWRATRRSRRALVYAVAGTAALAAALWAAVRWPMVPPASHMRRLSLGALPAAPIVTGRARADLAVSRDGNRAAYVSGEDPPRLFIREMDDILARPINGVTGAARPFFSPDGEWVGFTALGKTFKIRRTGGTAQKITDLPAGAGASWGADGMIVLAPGCVTGPSDCGLFRVPAEGGAPQPLTRADAGQGEIHSSPYLLPGGTGVLFVSESGGRAKVPEIRAVSLADGRVSRVLRGGEAVTWSATGHLLYQRGCALMAAPFDPRRLTFSGAVTAVENDVHAFASDDAGSLYIVPGCLPRDAELVSVDASGARPVSDRRQPYVTLAVSPEGNRVAVSMAEGPQWDVAVLEIERGRLVRVTSAPGRREQPAWSADGRRIGYAKQAPEELRGLYWASADQEAGIEEPLLLSKETLGSVSFAPDGSVLLYGRETDTAGEIWILPLSGDRVPSLLLAGENPRFSPDGRFVAYELQQGPTRDLWLAPYPGLEPRQLVATGGYDSVWARDSKALYFRAEGQPQRIMRAPIESAADEVRVGQATLFYEGAAWSFARGFDSTPGADRLIALRGDEPHSMEVVVLSGWARPSDLWTRLGELRRRYF